MLGFVVIADLLFYAWMTAFERHLIKETQTNTANYVNAMVSHMLTRQDFESIKTEDDPGFRNGTHVASLGEGRVWSSEATQPGSFKVLFALSPPHGDAF